MRNEFEDRVRLAFIDQWACGECGENGTRTGGLELHHIKGRESNSALNGIVLCKECHSHIGHSSQEENKYLEKTIKYLVAIRFNLIEEDLEFYHKYKYIYDTFKKA
jgi:hypothetical protein